MYRGALVSGNLKILVFFNQLAKHDGENFVK